MNDLHGIIFAYRSDPALRELTSPRNTCSVPFGGRYRVIDFALSNMVNAGVNDVGLIVQSSYQSLLDHVGSGKDFDLSRKRGGLRILPPFSYAGNHGFQNYRGRMDALAGVISYLRNIRQSHVVLASGEVLANLPLEDAFRQHLESGADITAVCAKEPVGEPESCTYFTVGGGNRITDVFLHPSTPKGYESLEVYILSKELLLSLVEHCASHDLPSFGQSVLLSMLNTLKIMPYIHEGFAARLHSVPAYFKASQALLDPAVRRDLFTAKRPIRTKDRSDPSTYYSPDAHVDNSLIADGCIIEGEVDHSILFRGVRVEKEAKVSHCICMPNTVIRAGASVSHVITDKGVTVGEGRCLMGTDTYPLAIAKDSTV